MRSNRILPLLAIAILLVSLMGAAASGKGPRMSAATGKGPSLSEHQRVGDPAKPAKPTGCQRIFNGKAGGYGEFSASRQPGPCWRPYGGRSPFNKRIPKSARPRPDSAAIVQELAGETPISDLCSGDPRCDYGVPIYWSKPTDPVYTLDCVEPWGRCDVEGMRIRVPAAARPAGGRVTNPPGYSHDAHMTIVDQQTGWEYDLWSVRRKGRNGGRLAFGWGGRVRIDGQGLRGYANAAGYGLLGGLVRLSEFRSGIINHALLLAVPCSSDYVSPAEQGSTSCADAGIANRAPAPLGSRFQLTISVAEIEAMRLPPWKEGILLALRRYGAYVSDTTGDSRSWGIEIESPETYMSFGKRNPLLGYGRSLGHEYGDFWATGRKSVHFRLANGIDWTRMRVIR